MCFVVLVLKEDECSRCRWILFIMKRMLTLVFSFKISVKMADGRVIIDGCVRESSDWVCGWNLYGIWKFCYYYNYTFKIFIYLISIIILQYIKKNQLTKLMNWYHKQIVHKK